MATTLTNEATRDDLLACAEVVEARIDSALDRLEVVDSLREEIGLLCEAVDSMPAGFDSFDEASEAAALARYDAAEARLDAAFAEAKRRLGYE